MAQDQLTCCSALIHLERFISISVLHINNGRRVMFNKIKTTIIVVFLVQLGFSTSLFANELQPSPVHFESASNPTYFQVSGVSADDVLHVRAEPNTSAEIVGDLASDAGPIEVLYSENGWAYLSSGESMGWASKRFLTQIELPKIANSALPQGLTCGGTEPFWSIAISDESVELSQMNEGKSNFSIMETGTYSGDTISFIVAGAEGTMMTSIISNEIYGDGMSDKDYGRKINILLSTPDGTRGYLGACSVKAN